MNSKGAFSIGIFFQPPSWHHHHHHRHRHHHHRRDRRHLPDTCTLSSRSRLSFSRCFFSQKWPKRNGNSIRPLRPTAAIQTRLETHTHTLGLTPPTNNPLLRSTIKNSVSFISLCVRKGGELFNFSSPISSPSVSRLASLFDGE